MKDEMYSWDVIIHRAWLYHTEVRHSFLECGFSIRPVYSDRTGAGVLNRFTVDHTSAGALTYWELRYGIARFPHVLTVREVRL